MTISSGSQYKIHYNTTTTVTGGLTNNGTIMVNFDTYTWPYLTFNGSQTLCGTGTVAMTGGIINTSNSGDVLTVAAGQTISGVGQINATLNNLGTVEAQNGTITVASPVTQFSGSTLTGGTWIACANSTLNVSSAGNISTNQGTVILNGATPASPTSTRWPSTKGVSPFKAAGASPQPGP